MYNNQKPDINFLCYLQNSDSLIHFSNPRKRKGKAFRRSMEIHHRAITEDKIDHEKMNLRQPEKDPRRIARGYQTELCKKALEENIIVCLETGAGKTHIAVLVMYEMRHLFNKPQDSVCIFLAPTTALVQQQAKVIEESIDVNVRIHGRGTTHARRSHGDWEKEIKEYEVLVMTPELMLHYLAHCFIKMEQIALLIFDECHHAQVDSNHPYAQIMKIFYQVELVKCPRIFGMTASPKLGKGCSVDGLEAIMHSKVCTIENKDDVEQFATSAKSIVYEYGSTEKSFLCPYMVYSKKLEEIRDKCMLTLGDTEVDQNTGKFLQKLHSDVIYFLKNLGIRGALQATYISLAGGNNETAELVDAQNNCSDCDLRKNYLHEVSSILASDCTRGGLEADITCTEVLQEPFVSEKILRLIEILSRFRLQPNMNCIIFVNRIVTARSLSAILQNLKILSSWKCDFLVGVRSGHMSQKHMDIILEKFRSGQLNLLVATKVGEEGLDIHICSLVIRFDLPETLASFIQSRGRARMPQSEYAFLVNRSNLKEVKLIQQFVKEEALMNLEISGRQSRVQVTNFRERTYKVEATGATISSVMSVSLLHRYCSSLPHDEYSNPKLQFFYHDHPDGNICTLVLPANAPFHQIGSAPRPSKEAAKRDACLKAYQTLHEVGSLTDYLLPEQDVNNEDLDLTDSDNEDCVESRLELHQMLVPAALRVPWREVDNFCTFSCYYVKFNPIPADRTYRKFGLFVKESLPEEAGNLSFDLCLDKGRMVKTQLIPSGGSTFDKAEIALAETFQKLFLKVLVDRHEFKEKYVSLEDNNAPESDLTTFYLLLPVVEHEHDRFSVDWTLINRCLSSMIFKHMGSDVKDNVCEVSGYLHLASGSTSFNATLSSLVYLPCKDTFFFVSDILTERNAYDSYSDSENHVEHYSALYDIHLKYPHQPLLKAKPLFTLKNLLRKKNLSGEWREKEEYIVHLPPELCELKIVGFSKDIGSSLSLLPSIMHRLESFLVAIELKDKLSASFPEGAEVTTGKILEAITSEGCNENFSLERLEILGDAFLKFAVGRYLFLKHDALDEGQLTRKRSKLTNNHNLFKLAKLKNLQVYIRDQTLEPCNFFAFGRPCPLTCNKKTEESIHPQCSVKKNGAKFKVRCSKFHHWLHKKTIADVVESLTGAFIVDSGFKAAIAFLNWIGIKVDLSPSQVDAICSMSRAFLPLANLLDVDVIEKILGHEFTHKGLLIQAFVHPSFNNFGGCYQRLEYLGDAVLDYVVTSYLYTTYPEMKPGQLTDLRSMSVSNLSFADVAGRLSMHKFVICDSIALRESMSKFVNEIGNFSSEAEDIEERTYPKVLGDLVESCVGAIFLDTGFDLNSLWKIVLSLLDPVVNTSRMQFNPLRELIELCQLYNWDLHFSKEKKNGEFVVDAKVDNAEVSETACASNVSGRTAKKIAARQIIRRLKALGYSSKSKSLKDVVRDSRRLEAKLIGYDEVPSIPKLVEVPSIPKPVEVPSMPQQVEVPSTPQQVEVPLALELHPQHKGCGSDSPAIPVYNGSGSATSSVNARSCLNNICAAKHWRTPVFDCIKETGLHHSKQFVYKVQLQIAGKLNEEVECIGEPRLKKKDAAESAAEGALWHLKNEGHIL
ncbi:dicer-like protein 4 isoform X1 [Salvia splendens]|uniref:dicer-like protein 4 isoform X1 n=3 Tax=Salvia splendens TaxID=180675 RepID=UPI001C2768CB|nr:dicer-like protein 4 isoform X1 [Salvia splendens]